MLAPTMRSSKSSWDDFPYFIDPKLAPNLEVWFDEPEPQLVAGQRINPTPASVMKSGPQDWPPPNLNVSKSTTAPAECSCPHTPPVLQHHVCPAAEAPAQSIGSLCPMAFWSVQSRKLLAFNDGFSRLVQLPAVALQQSGVRWDSFADSFQCDPIARKEFDDSYARLKVVTSTLPLFIVMGSQSFI